MASDRWYHFRRRDDAIMNEDLEPGEYRAPRSRDGTPRISWRCPGCRRILWLARENHTVQFDGYINPPVGCPHRNCNFDEWMYLENWIPKSEGQA